MKINSIGFAPLTLSITLAVGFLSAVSVSYADSHSKGRWLGTWQDSEGGIMFIQQDKRYLTVTGKDESSTYTAHCLVGKELADKAPFVAKCVGNGTQITSGKRFLYRTTWRLQKRQILEHWFAEFEDESLEGNLVFEPTKPHPN